MPFGFGPGETLLALLVLIVVYMLPLGIFAWIVVTLMRLQRGQVEMLAKLASIERRLRASP